MRWLPLVTFVQTATDAMSAMLTGPGEFGSFGHDYRADMARFVRDTYDLPATEAQLERIEQVLRSMELERAERITAEHAPAAPPAPEHPSGDDTIRGGVPLRSRQPLGARLRRREGRQPSGRQADT
jgi:hypothetical protein